MSAPGPSSPFPKPAVPRPATARHAPTIDSVTTINDDGSHYKLQPADVRGRFTHWRRLSAYALIVLYLALPWIPVGGYPALFLDVATRRFHFFGYTLAAQDAWLLFFGVSGLGFILFFITALLGRIWCGWACPQTVFLEHVYRVIERAIEGDAPARRALDNAPWDTTKILRRGTKQALFVLVSLIITHLFLAYFVSIPELWDFMRADPSEHWAAFVFVFFSAGVIYFNFAWFREQLCIVICPYGRLQSALVDDHSLVIGYDTNRGEPRGKLRRPSATDLGDPIGYSSHDALSERAEKGNLIGYSAFAGSPTVGLGDCVACNRCVQVCPTGIDIRHGLQLECIGCAACIDACDEVMTKIKRPTGLIRYDSLVGFAGAATRWLRPRTIAYAVLLCVGITVAGFSFISIKPASFTVFRMTGAAYFVDHDTVRNQFMLRLLNKHSSPVALTVSIETTMKGVTTTGFGAPVTLAPLGEQVTPLVLSVTRHHYAGPFKFTVHVRAAAGMDLKREVQFLGPDPRLLREDEEARDKQEKAKEGKHDR